MAGLSEYAEYAATHSPGRSMMSPSFISSFCSLENNGSHADWNNLV
jgi:hypothetical protein